MEEWKTHPEHPKYEVSNLGKVRHALHKHVIVKPIHRGPHYAVILGIHNVLLRHLVADVWVPNFEKHKNVRHKNGDLHDNRSENLEWYSKSCKGGRKKQRSEGITVSLSSDSSWEERLSQITFSRPPRTVTQDSETGEWIVQIKFDNEEDAKMFAHENEL